MPRANVSATYAERPARDLLADYATHLALTGRGNSFSFQGATAFVRRWPDPQDWVAQWLTRRLGEGPQTTSFLMFLMVDGWLQPGYDYLVSRKLSSFGAKLMPARSRRTWLGFVVVPRPSATRRSNLFKSPSSPSAPAHPDQRASRAVDPG